MRSDRKPRVRTEAAPSLLTGLGHALASVALPDVLPAALPVTTVPPTTQPLWKLGRVVLRREKAHRGGKTVIVIDDFATHLPLSVIEQVAKRVRTVCGCGGTVKGRCVEIQGDDAAKIRAVLEGEGFQVAGVR